MIILLRYVAPAYWASPGLARTGVRLSGAQPESVV